MGHPDSLRVVIDTDGKASSSGAIIKRDQAVEEVHPDKIFQASASVTTNEKTGVRVITATLWANP